MKFIKLLILLSIISTTFSCNRKVKNVRITCIHMQYACGDDCADYKVLSISNVSKDIEKEILNKDIIIVDENNIDISENIDSCLTCYIFETTGYLEKKFGTYILHANSVEKVIRKDCCILLPQAEASNTQSNSLSDA